ncbi:MAG TPA: carboxypeptidase-like regulatory domain-containing protein, partial [Balneolales bacterium]|nr:carboxypeptidase-like regulatory domain-containing protein [Balneolales bacterium]
MKKVLLNILLLGVILLFGGLTHAYAQERTIQGTVRDASTSTPLPGVNVRVPNTEIGTATDEDGHYSLSIPATADSLEFTYIGYNPLFVAIGNRTTVNVTLKPQVEQFESVVVTAMGTKRQQRSLGYSSQNITTQEVEKNPSTNFVNDLQGKVAGVNITNSQGSLGSSSRITLR